jgi:hypothetical protein
VVAKNAIEIIQLRHMRDVFQLTFLLVDNYKATYNYRNLGLYVRKFFKCSELVKFELLSADAMKTTIVWDVPPCSLVYIYLHSCNTSVS